MMTQGRAREIYSIKGGILLGIRKYGKNRVIRFANAIVAMIKRMFKSIFNAHYSQNLGQIRLAATF